MEKGTCRMVRGGKGRGASRAAIPPAQLALEPPTEGEMDEDPPLELVPLGEAMRAVGLRRREEAPQPPGAWVVVEHQLGGALQQLLGQLLEQLEPRQRPELPPQLFEWLGQMDRAMAEMRGFMERVAQVVARQEHDWGNGLPRV